MAVARHGDALDAEDSFITQSSAPGFGGVDVRADDESGADIGDRVAVEILALDRAREHGAFSKLGNETKKNEAVAHGGVASQQQEKPAIDFYLKIEALSGQFSKLVFGYPCSIGANMRCTIE